MLQWEDRKRYEIIFCRAWIAERDRTKYLTILQDKMGRDRIILPKAPHGTEQYKISHLIYYFTRKTVRDVLHSSNRRIEDWDFSVSDI